MKYIVDIDALVNCIDLTRGGMKINGDIYLPLEVVKEFIKRFPKDLPGIESETTGDST